jgi:hypothetical protein
MAALRFHEKLEGKIYFLDEPLVERDVSLEIEAHLRDFRTRIATVTGRIHAPDLADAPVQGTIGLHGIHDRRVPYDLAFVDQQMRVLRFRGEKDLSWLAPVETLVVLPFTIHENEREIARGTMRSETPLGAFARSIRLAPL